MKRERDDAYQQRYADPYKRPRSDVPAYPPNYPPSYQPAAYQSISQPINQSYGYPPQPNYPPNYPINQPPNQSIKAYHQRTDYHLPPQSIKPPIKPFVSQYPPPPQPSYPSAYQPPVNQSINQSTSQSVNQSADSLRLLIDGSHVIEHVMRSLPMIEKMSGVQISVVSPKIMAKVDERILVIDGPDSAKSKLVSALLDVLSQLHDPFHAGVQSELTLKLLCHKLRIGAVIGRGGESVKATQQQSGAKISVTGDSIGGSSEKVITLAGSVQAINQAVLIVLEQLKAHPLRDQTPYVFYEPGTPHNVLLPSEARRAFGAPPWQPFGFAAPAARTESFSARVAIPAVCSGCVLGKAGSIIKELRATTNTNISLADPTPEAPNERVVTISGTPGNIHQAIELIREAVERYRE